MFVNSDGSAGDQTAGPVAVLVADPVEAAELERRAAFAAMLDVEDLLATGAAEEPVEPWAQVGFDAWLEALVEPPRVQWRLGSPRLRCSTGADC